MIQSETTAMTKQLVWREISGIWSLKFGQQLNEEQWVEDELQKGSDDYEFFLSHRLGK